MCHQRYERIQQLERMTEQNRTEHGTEQNRTRNKTEQNRTEHGTKQHITEQNRTEQKLYLFVPKFVNRYTTQQ